MSQLNAAIKDSASIMFLSQWLFGLSAAMTPQVLGNETPKDSDSVDAILCAVKYHCFPSTLFLSTV